MKKNLFAFLTCFIVMLYYGSSLLTAQETRTFNFNHQNKDGINVVEQTRGGMTLNFTINTLNINSLDYKGEEMHEISVNGISLPNDKGLPNVPAFSRLIAIPQGSEAVINIISYEKEIVKNINIVPSLGIEPQVVEPSTDYIKNDKVYSKNAFYPEAFTSLGQTTTMRGVDIVPINFTPVQFNPVTKEAVVYHNIEISVEYVNGNGQFGDNSYRSPYFDPILAQNLINYNDLPEIDYEARFQQWIKDDAEGYEYIIVTPNNDAWAPYAKQLADLRTKQGISTVVYRLDEMEVSSTAELKAWFHNAYNTWEIKPVAVCLFGDHNNNMAQGIPAEVIPHSYSGTCITDNQYADPDGNLLPDMVFSRLVAENESELPIFVGKQIEYEVENPNMDEDSYKYPVTALGWQTKRWFQICSEVVGGYFRTVGKEPVRINKIYEGTPGNIWSSADNTDMVVEYFGPNGLGYLPATPGEMGDWNSGTPQDIVDAINSGTFLVQHRDHGLEQGWGEPAFRNSHIDQLTNVGKLPFVMSINCLTGKYNLSTPCFAEKFMRYTYNGQNAGAVGMLCPTEVSFSFVNDAFVWGVYDQFDPNFLPDMGPFAPRDGNWFPAFGNVAGKYFLYQSSWPYNYYDKDITYQMFTAHCDAFLRLYSEQPQTLNVTHSDVQLAGSEYFNITAPEGTTIALTKNNGNMIEILAVAEATGSQQTIDIPMQNPPTIITVVVTGQNYIRYEQEVEVIPADGPYVIVESYELGDNNAQLDYGETACFDLVFKNVGIETSSSATATLVSESEYITVTNPTISVDALSPDQTISINDAFEFVVSDSVPNNTKNQLVVNVECDGEIFQSIINVRAYAPDLKVSDMILTEINGNGNGRLDPSEQAELTFTMKNEGLSTANDIVSSILLYNPFMSVISDNLITTFVLEPDESITLNFIIEATDNVPAGFVADFSVSCQHGLYNHMENFSIKIGLIVEDFESGDLSNFEWTNSDPKPWTFDTSVPYEGEYCMKSGAIGNNGSTSLILNYDVTSGDQVSFYVKISSESGWDKLHFYIDNVEKETWSGEKDWAFVSYAVDEGQHTFKWTYKKDSSASDGQDCAWIDFVELPAEKTMVVHAGFDITSCSNNDVQLQSFIYFADYISWSTSGDGSFSDNTIDNPIYTPGNQDIQNGSVTLTVTGTDVNGNSISDELILTLEEAPSLELDETATICENDSYYSNAIANNYSSLEWKTSGDGIFNYTNIAEAIYTPGTQDIANGNVILTLTAFGCTDISENVELTIGSVPTLIEFNENTTACANSTAEVYMQFSGVAPFTVKLQGIETEYQILDDNILNISVDNESVSYTLSEVIDATGCSATLSESFNINVVVLQTPEKPSGDLIIVKDENGSSTYYTEHIDGMTSYEWVLEPSEAGIIDGNSNEVNINWNMDFNGNLTLKVRGISDICGATEFSESIDIFSSMISVDELSSESLNIYPNPANNVLNINIDNIGNNKAKIMIFNILGETVYSEITNTTDNALNTQINVENLTKGSYLLTISTDNFVWKKQILIY